MEKRRRRRWPVPGARPRTTLERRERTTRTSSIDQICAWPPALSMVPTERPVRTSTFRPKEPNGIPAQLCEDPNAKADVLPIHTRPVGRLLARENGG